ncbi:hypothetical protein H310_02322 [Aphanomyces invadans]|uniref:Uncharacterized protein n=1 Tax=Aphanomyces invadans TaxID=157072 RepID=A0A024UND1_9STRA|nr:hypothetical protein H310_02322 [Aphanomyces invadans]ETW07916.1 hypothetical protein H310_02322 [Aphanomyces invadans]|eukprot:XP_008864009.1 hypothetical protein H310_02322 [Aphanomyces invadans]
MLPSGHAGRRHRRGLSSATTADTSSIEELQLLQRAARKGRHDLVASLIMNGADINETDSNGHTAAHQAARNGHIKVLEVLHALGADLNKCSLRGVSIAHQAAFGGHLDFLQRLVDLNVRVDLVDANDLTPLEVAMREKKWLIVEYLESIYSQMELPTPTSSPATLDQELMTMLNAPPLEFSSPSLHAMPPTLRSADDSHATSTADEMHTSSLRLHSLLPFTHDSLDDDDVVQSTPSPPCNRRKRSAAEAALDVPPPTTPVHESSKDGEVASSLTGLSSSPHQDYPVRSSPWQHHMVSLPPIASPSSWQVKTLAMNPLRSTSVSWRGSKQQQLHNDDDIAPSHLRDIAVDGELGLSTVHNLLYDM